MLRIRRGVLVYIMDVMNNNNIIIHNYTQNQIRVDAHAPTESLRNRSLEREMQFPVNESFLHVRHPLYDLGQHLGHLALVNVCLLTGELLQKFLG